MKTILAAELIKLIKSKIDFKGEDVFVSVDELIAMDNSIKPDELFTVLTDMSEVKISDKGITIPKGHFT